MYQRVQKIKPERTRPNTPRPNGKAERFVPTSLRERTKSIHSGGAGIGQQPGRTTHIGSRNKILIDAWLSLPLPALILNLAAFYTASALVLVRLSFGARVGPWVRSFRGV